MRLRQLRSDSDLKTKVRLGLEIMVRFCIEIFSSCDGRCQNLTIADVRGCSTIGPIVALICAGTSRWDDEVGVPLRSAVMLEATCEQRGLAQSATNAIVMEVASASCTAGMFSAATFNFRPQHQRQVVGRAEHTLNRIPS